MRAFGGCGIACLLKVYAQVLEARCKTVLDRRSSSLRGVLHTVLRRSRFCGICAVGAG